MKTLLPLIAILTLFACSQQSETASLRQSLSSFAKPPQTFTINPNADTAITTASGLMIGIPAHSFTTSDTTTVDQPITIEIIEVRKKSEMIFNGISTVSNNRLLESFWMFHIRATSNGKELMVKEGSTLGAIAKNIKADSTAATFYGIENNGIIEWETIADELAIADRTVGDDLESQLNQIFRASFNRLGWINCDRFVSTSDTKPIKVQTTQNYDAQYSIVFDNINSVLSGLFLDSLTATTGPLPSGYTVNVLVTDFHNGQYYFASQRFKTGDTELVSLEPKPLSKDDFQKEIAKLDEPKK